jgi:hypothetical protein
MAQAVKKKLIVCGGNGFLGKNLPSVPVTELKADYKRRKSNL